MAHSTSNANIADKPPLLRLPPFLRPLVKAVLDRVWYVHAPIKMVLTIPPAIALQVLTTAAKPSTQRLHLRNVFVGGRRYYVQPTTTNTFVMISNAKVAWRYSQRTRAVATLIGKFTIDHAQTSIELRSHIKLMYFLDVFLLPSWITLLIFSMPWEPLFLVGSIALLYGFSWFGHRYNAMLEAHEMIFFIEKAFEDYVPQPLPELATEGAHIVYDRQRDFAVAWDKFYDEVVNAETTDQKE